MANNTTLLIHIYCSPFPNVNATRFRVGGGGGTRSPAGPQALPERASDPAPRSLGLNHDVRIDVTVEVPSGT